ncbi:uncharacterized protein LOC131163703 [Malania oleifera]|uniref:uncharacterized protein LOC131163703 n=1 Tax=Malania oleifera TaxID=397392 RepID=UPI0025ADC2C0|nr:uncharacterized protein LOC131163703 [Malania oleifera]
MGKGTDLWDDSALINAFDDAIAKYKLMHSKGYNNCSAEEGNVISRTGDNASAPVDEIYEAERYEEADKDRIVPSNIATERGETSNLSSVEENKKAVAYVLESHIGSSNGAHMQNELKDYSNSQGAEDYNDLLNQYYGLEEQRQKILQRLHQLGSWNYDYSAEGSGSFPQCADYSTSQEHQPPRTQASHPAAACSYCPCACQCLLAPCLSVPACCMNGTYVGKTCSVATMAEGSGKLSPFKDGDIVRTAMCAAEKAISSMKMRTSGEETQEEKNKCEMGQSANSETDLTAVLNAWYSAGFYTGKYLVEQATAGKRHF